MPARSQQLKSFEEADSALRALGEAQRDLAQLELECQAAIDATKARLTKARLGPDAVIKGTSKLLKQFVLKNKDKIEERGAKTIQLHFGRIGTRLAPPKLQIDEGITEENVIYLIRREHPDLVEDLIETKERIRREAIKDFLDDEQLQIICCSMEQNDIVVIEPANDVAAEVGAA